MLGIADALVKVEANIKATGLSHITGPKEFWDDEFGKVYKLITQAQLYVAAAGSLSVLIIKRKRMNSEEFTTAVAENIAALKEMEF